VVRRRVLLAGQVRQSAGVGAVFSSDHENGVHIPGQTDDFLLSFFRGGADRFEDDRLRTLFPDFFNDPPVMLRVLGGLRDKTDLFQGRQFFRVFEGRHDRAASPGIAQQTVHFRMLAVARDDDRVAQRRMLLDDRLDIAHFGAGGVNDFDAAFLDFFSFCGGDAVRPDDQHRLTPVGNFVDAADGGDAAARQNLDGLRIVDQRPVRVNAPALLALGDLQDRVHRAADAHAESGCLGEFNFHCFGSFAPV
jgi:hypothetical protein